MPSLKAFYGNSALSEYNLQFYKSSHWIIGDWTSQGAMQSYVEENRGTAFNQ